MTDEITLSVRGEVFRGWTSVFVEKSLYQMVGSFSLTGTNIFPGNAQEWGIAMGDECKITIDDQDIITGYIDDIPIIYDAENHNIQLNGRDKTSDLVDCSFVQEGDDQVNEWKGQKIIRIIEDLANAFGIAVSVDNSIFPGVSLDFQQDTVESRLNEKLPYESNFKANEGDTVFDLILKLCQMKAVLPISYGDGWLRLTEAGAVLANDSLQLGVNIKAGAITQSNRDRFSRYIVKGQGEKTKDNTGAEASQVKGEYLDAVVSRYRPFVILSEYKIDNKWAQDRAKWEAVNRAGTSRNVEYEIRGWTQSNGAVWPLNALVSVRDDFLEIKDNEPLLIAAIDFIQDEESGTITRLTLVHPDSFKLPPSLDPIKTISSGFDWLPLLQAGL